MSFNLEENFHFDGEELTELMNFGSPMQFNEVEPLEEKENDNMDIDEQHEEKEEEEEVIEEAAHENGTIPIPQPLFEPTHPKYIHVPPTEFRNSSPIGRRIEVVEDLAAEYTQYLNRSPLSPTPIPGENIPEILKSLQDNGFAIVDFPSHDNLIPYIKSVLDSTYNIIENTPEVKNLMKYYNQTPSRQILGFGNCDKDNKEKTEVVMDTLTHDREYRILLNTIVPLIQNLLHTATNNEYTHEKHVWLSNVQPLFYNREGNNAFTRKLSFLKSTIQTVQHGEDISQALYLSPYLYEYLHQDNPEGKRPQPLEHLQLFVPLTTLDSEVNASIVAGNTSRVIHHNQKNSIRIIPGFHKVFDKVVKFISNNDKCVETGEIHGTNEYWSFMNPTCEPNLYYRLSPEFMDTFASYVIDIPIHAADSNVNRLIIMDPRMGLSIKFTSACALLPVSIWPIEKPTNLLLSNELTQYRRHEFKTGQTSTPLAIKMCFQQGSIKGGPNILYNYHRRAYFKGYVPEIMKKNRDKIYSLLKLRFIDPVNQTYSKIEEEYYVNGFPDDFVREQHDKKNVYTPLMNQITNKPNEKQALSTFMETIQQIAILNEVDFPDPIIQILPQDCQSCHKKFNIYFTLFIENNGAEPIQTRLCTTCVHSLIMSIK